MFNKDKGFVVFKNAFVTDISEKSMDYTIKVEPRNKKEKNGAALYLVIIKDGENAIHNSMKPRCRKSKIVS